MGGHEDLEAACHGEDPNEFFPKKGRSAANAKRICRRCPVRVGCLDAAIGSGQRYGVWGGFTDPDRARIAKEIRDLDASARASYLRELCENDVADAAGRGTAG
ncbi:WhiB family transcriptional regulator [Mycolicibacterium senegalense]|uniref:WhiB family transcriptional regulator n=1 Tax=Mycobacteriaceae TaxID=1762 RepID=UPI003AAAFE98